MKRKKWELATICISIIVLFSVSFVIYENINKSKKNSNRENISIDEGQANKANDGMRVQDNNENNSLLLKEEENKRPNFDNLNVKALYVTANNAANRDKLESLIKIVNETEINAFVIDAKETKVNYESNIPFVRDNNLDAKVFNYKEIIDKLHQNNIYAIARIVCFRDNELAKRRPDWAIKKNDGSLWKENGNIAWTNPYNKEVWNYNIEIAKEAAKIGFDEIQFDYVRFPTGTGNNVNYGLNMPERSSAVNEFLELAAIELGDIGVKVTADIFGIVCESEPDGRNIGQVLESVGKDIDAICPMIYPSHFANETNRSMGNGTGQYINNVLFKAPDLKPYDVVLNTLLKTRKRLEEVGGYKADVRPYLQAFTAKYLPAGYYQNYGPQQIKEQIQAVYDAGYDSWILWNPGNVYPTESFLKENEK